MEENNKNYLDWSKAKQMKSFPAVDKSYHLIYFQKNFVKNPYNP